MLCEKAASLSLNDVNRVQWQGRVPESRAYSDNRGEGRVRKAVWGAKFPHFLSKMHAAPPICCRISSCHEVKALGPGKPLLSGTCSLALKGNFRIIVNDA